jgi:hypothetical protein
MAQSKESLLAQVYSLRGLSRRACRLSQTLSQVHDQQRLVRYAEELEEEASRLEKEAVSAKTSKPLPSTDSG